MVWRMEKIEKKEKESRKYDIDRGNVDRVYAHLEERATR